MSHLKKLYLVQQELLNQGLVTQAQEAQDIATGFAGNAMNFDEDDDKGSKKKTVLSTYESMAIIAR